MNYRRPGENPAQAVSQKGFAGDKVRNFPAESKKISHYKEDGQISKKSRKKLLTNRKSGDMMSKTDEEV